MSIYQIRQGTRLHSRATQRISHRIRLTFTSITVHTHCHWHAHFLIISTADHSPWVVGVHWQQKQLAAGKRQTAGSSGGQQHRTATAADTLDITDCMNFWKFPQKIYHYSQQQLFAYRVTEEVSAATGNDSCNSRSGPAMFSFKIHTLF